MLALTSSPPHTITLQEHAELTSSTPASFEDIPPVLRFVDEEVEVEFDPDWVEVSRGEGKVKGTLWVTERSITFLPASVIASSSSSQQGYTLPYPTLTLHAISPASGPEPAFLYCQLDDPSVGKSGSVQNGVNGNGNAFNGEGGEESDEDEDDEVDEDEDTPMRELKVYLKSGEQLNALFASLSYCSSLYPSLDPSSNGFGALGSDGDAQEQALNFGPGGSGGFDPERLLAGISIPGMEGEFEDAEDEGVDGVDGVEGQAGTGARGGEAGVNGAMAQDQVDSEAGRRRSDFQGSDPRFKPY